MHVTILSKVLELAANLAYWSALWLLAKLFGRSGEIRGEIRGGDASGIELDGMALDGIALDGAVLDGVELNSERDRVLTVRASRRRTTVVVVRSEEGADGVIVSIGVTR
jgi:hypothetical protein